MLFGTRRAASIAAFIIGRCLILLSDALQPED